LSNYSQTMLILEFSELILQLALGKIWMDKETACERRRFINEQGTMRRL